MRRLYDFETVTMNELTTIKWDFFHIMARTGICHGYCLYFEAHFRKGTTDQYISLKTGPEEPATHWYQTRMLLKEPIGVTKGQMLKGNLVMIANSEQSFDGELKVEVPGLANTTNKYDMKDLEYRGAYLSYYDWYNQ